MSSLKRAVALTLVSCVAAGAALAASGDSSHRTLRLQPKSGGE